MLKVSFLRNIFLLSLAIAILIPAYEVFFIQPSYDALLIENTEKEAARLVHYLARTLELGSNPVEKGKIPAEVIREVELLRDNDHLLANLRFFSPTGEIVYSFIREEIGTVNRKDYFVKTIARGNVYSKVVNKDAFTADGIISAIDLVETYVPIMQDKRFIGAIEVYYDITERRQKFQLLSFHTTIFFLFLCSGLLSIMVLLLLRGKREIIARQQAEESLRLANSELEQRVIERTGQLLLINRSLTREISERTQAQQSLAEALREIASDKEKLDCILRSVEEGLVVTDGEQRIILANPAADSLLGVGVSGMTGLPLAESIDNLQLRKNFAELPTDSPERAEFTIFRPGATTPTEVQAGTSAIYDASGRRIGQVTVLHDITRERLLERMKSEFISMAVHELQTPLTAIVGYSSLLNDPENDRLSLKERQEFLACIQEKAETLVHIFRDLLDIGQAEAGRLMPLEKGSFPIAALATRLVGQYRKSFPSHRFELHFEDETQEITADRNRIAQVLENLLSNAVKYSAGGEIRVSGKIDGQYYLISVHDEGIGMTPEQVAHIFEKFYRADSSKRSVPGIGLGMSIASFMVEAHDGRIWVESPPGRGTVVHFTLPISTLPQENCSFETTEQRRASEA